MTIRVTTDIVFDGHSAVEIQQAYEFEKANDMSIWKKYDSTYCIVFRKEERTHCEVFDWSNEKSDFCSFGERKADG